MSSTRTRLSLRRWLLAIRSTCLAMGAGRDTLRRTCFVAGIASLYTSLVHYLPAHSFAKNANEWGTRRFWSVWHRPCSSW
jgi:hypothetical protein